MSQKGYFIHIPPLHFFMVSVILFSIIFLRVDASAQTRQPARPVGIADTPPPGYKLLEQTELFGSALRYQKLASEVPANIAHIVRMSLVGSQLRLAISAEDRKGSTPSELALADSSLVSLNGSFFDDRMRALGLVVSHFKAWKGSRDTSGYFVFGCINPQTCNLETAPGLIGGGGSQTPFETAISGRPILVTKGNPRTAKDDAQCPQFCDKRHPRAAIALDRSRNEVILALAEGRQALAQGFTLAEFGVLLSQVGAHDAVNLDGGGSATLVLKGKRVSGRPFGEKTERPVANVISILRP